jgi:putative pyruvate formate lyase activating enzyme
LAKSLFFKVRLAAADYGRNYKVVNDIGWNGSGTIFFGMCNLRCVFCQNWDISQRKKGWTLTAEEIADLMMKLQDETKCHNVNFVTPEHVVPQVVEAVNCAVRRGFNLPIVYNTSSYDSHESLELLDGIVDIYMPDFKVGLDSNINVTNF